MLEKVRLEDFGKLYEIMEKSFPLDEYRPIDEQRKLFDNKYYRPYGVFDGERMKAFIALWEFDEFIYVEHFAVNPNERNGGIGSKILKELIETTDKTICLEVEPPETELATRRISFYERNGFFLNEYPYMQPAISKGRNPIKLLIMTSKCKINEETFLKVKNKLYTEVYKISK